MGPVTTRAACLASLVASVAVVGSSSVPGCKDKAWTDADGDGCTDYAKEGWCNADWAKQYATPNTAGKAQTATEACCACGGGLRDGEAEVPTQAEALGSFPLHVVGTPAEAPANMGSLPELPPLPKAVERQLPPLPRVRASPPATDEQLPDLPPLPYHHLPGMPKLSQESPARQLAREPVSPASGVDDPLGSPGIGEAPMGDPRQLETQAPRAAIPKLPPLGDLHGVMAKVRDKLAAREAKVSERESNVAALESQMREREAAVAHAEEAARNATSAQQELESVEEAELRRSLRAAKSEVTKEIRRADALESTLNSTEKEAKTARLEAEAQTAELQAQLRAANAERSQEKEAITAWRSAATGNATARAGAEREVQELRAALEKARADFRGKLSKAQGELQAKLHKAEAALRQSEVGREAAVQAAMKAEEDAEAKVPGKKPNRAAKAKVKPAKKAGSQHHAAVAKAAKRQLKAKGGKSHHKF